MRCSKPARCAPAAVTTRCWRRRDAERRLRRRAGARGYAEGGGSPRAGGGVKVGVLGSGEGSNLQAILDTVHGAEAQVVVVGSDKPEARALQRATAAGVPTRVFEAAAFPDRHTRDVAMADWLGEAGVELVVLAGYMQILDSAFLGRFPQRVINVHPTLLPAFPGIGSVQQAVDYGVKVIGVTVHFVDEG